MGEELLSPVQKLNGHDGGTWEALAAIASAQGLTVNREATPGEDANGFYVRAERRIWVSPYLQPLQSAKTLAHELSHHFAKHAEKSHSRDEAEMIAESSAFVVMAHLGKTPVITVSATSPAGETPSCSGNGWRTSTRQQKL